MRTIRLSHYVVFCVAGVVACAFLPAALSNSTSQTSSTGTSQNSPLSPAQAVSHVGEWETVGGKVAEVVHSRGGATFLDFDAPYPLEAFTAVIFAENADQFAEADTLEGKKVSVSGTVQLYHGRPEIVIRSRNQLSD